jgi:hypothetical protein
MMAFRRMRYFAEVWAGVLLCTALLACSAQAQEWERLPDGRVIILVKNVRFVIPTVPEFLDRTELHQDDLRVRMRLRAVVDNPDAARKWFASTTQEIAFTTMGAYGRATKGPEVFSTAVSGWQQQLWRGSFGFTILDEVRRTPRPDSSVAEFRRRDVSCDTRRRGFRYEFKNITTLDDFTGRRHFNSCAGPLRIGYSLPAKNFPQQALPEVQDALVSFFTAMFPDYPLEVYP